MKIISALFLLCIITFKVQAQQFTVDGTITDNTGKPVPFTSIHVKNSTKGSSANSEGRYTLQLSEGNYTLQYKAIGYAQETREISIHNHQTINVTLKAETYQLKGVSISAKAEDPAYAIIRKAIKKRRLYAHEVKAYTCNVYIKGLQKLLDAPKKFMGYDVQKATREAGLDSNRRGIVYLSESESKLSFMEPDKVHEEMISSKVSGSNRAFSYNRASDLKINFYDNTQNWQGFSNRPLISPIADNALFYYRYKWMGITVENGETINKIQVTPRRNYDPCFEGYIYIIDDSWRIYGTGLFITKKANINFIDTLKIDEQFIQVNQRNWLPSSLKLEFTAGLLGFKLGGYFISIYKDYDLKPTFSKGEFNEVVRITSGVNKKDSTYWEQQRPIPLTLEEKTDYQRKEKLAIKHESKTYLDSLDSTTNKFKAGNLLIGGINIRNSYRKSNYHFDGLLNSVLFNTVEGFALNYGIAYTKRIDSTDRYFSIAGNARYGFSNHLFNANVNTTVPLNNYTLTISGGTDVVDLNNHNPILPFYNTLYSLFERQNYEKLYQKKYASATLTHRIVGGWLINAGAEWADRKWLPNTSSYSFFHPKGHEYTSNNPLVPDQDLPLFPENQSFKFTVRTTYDFSNRYETYPTGRRYLPSPYPTIGLNYVQGVKGILGSDVDYSLLSADISKSNISLGMLGHSSFYIGAGKFLNANQLYYPDYKQFSGNQILFYRDGLNSFLLLDYYRFSTSTKYLEGHLEHNFSGFITNKIPLIRKLKLQEIVDFNYLTTPELKNYSELGFGLQYLNIRAMYGISFHSGSHLHNGFRIGITFR